MSKDRDSWQPSLLNLDPEPKKSEPRVVYNQQPVRRRRADIAPVVNPEEARWWTRAKQAETTNTKVPTKPVELSWGVEWGRLLRNEGWTVELPASKRMLLESGVRSLDVRSGVIEGSVGGGGERPHRIQLKSTPLTGADWMRLARQVVDDKAEKTVEAELQRGAVPMALVDAADRHRMTLLTRRLTALGTACTCGGAQLPCDHVIAVHLMLARRLHREPALLLAYRGIDLKALFALFQRVREEATSLGDVAVSGADPYEAPAVPEPEWSRLTRAPRRAPLPSPEGWRAAESFDAMVRRITASARQG
jgi:uncharacterized Zn finger protein